MKQLSKKQLEALEKGRVPGIKRPNAGFKKGHIPWSKGKKGIHLSTQTEWKPGEIPKGSVLFKKGNIPWNKGKKLPSSSGALSSRWRGGRTLHQGKYWLIYRPEHPKSDSKGYVREHRLVMEEKLGRYLSTKELIHHKNGDTMDNSIDNLQIVSRTSHIKIHKEELYNSRWVK